MRGFLVAMAASLLGGFLVAMAASLLGTLILYGLQRLAIG